MTPPRVRSIDLSNPFARSLDGMCEILLVRHAEQEVYRNIPLGDAVDAPLSARGRDQAAALGDRLRDRPIDAVFTSPAVRAHDTARAVAAHHGITPVVVDDLREIDLWQRAPQDKGLLDLHSRDEVVAMYRAVSRARTFAAFPYVEDVAAFRERITGAIDRLAQANAGKRIGIFCHGGVINVYLSVLLGSAYDQLFSGHHTSVTTLRAADDRRAILTINDFSHVFAVQDSMNEVLP